MSIEDKVVEKLHGLPPDKQKQVLEFVESLSRENGSAHPLKSLYGLWSDLSIELSDHAIESARREMWGNFPRETH
jgi:hypothetical protein